jgi:hypothetical protein
VTKPVKDAMKMRKYFPYPLNESRDHFIAGYRRVDKEGILVVLSHGSEKGPMMIAGREGADNVVFMSDEEIHRFGDYLVSHNITLYLLSCNTGRMTIAHSTDERTFAAKLKDTNATFYAPDGYAKISTGDSVQFKAVEREDGGGSASWLSVERQAIDILRSGKSLTIP